jgi:hypothetical protein
MPVMPIISGRRSRDMTTSSYRSPERSRGRPSHRTVTTFALQPPRRIGGCVYRMHPRSHLIDAHVIDVHVCPRISGLAGALAGLACPARLGSGGGLPAVWSASPRRTVWRVRPTSARSEREMAAAAKNRKGADQSVASPFEPPRSG